MVNIRKLDIKKVNLLNRNIILAGKRGTGKSILEKDLLYKQYVHFHQPKRALFASPTADSTDEFKKIVNNECVTDKFDPAQLRELIDLQKRDSSVFNALVLLDDCMYDKKSAKSVEFRDLIMNGRHYNIGLWNAMQYIMDMSPDIRSNVDYVFAFRDSSRNTREKLWKYFFGIFPTYEEFSEVFDACTQNYGCMVIDNTKPANGIEDCVFWYKADANVPEFFMDCESIPSMKTKQQSNKFDHQILQNQSQQSSGFTFRNCNNNEGGNGFRFDGDDNSDDDDINSAHQQVAPKRSIVLLEDEDYESEQEEDQEEVMDEDEDENEEQVDNQHQQQAAQENQPQHIHLHLHLPVGWNNTSFSFSLL